MRSYDKKLREQAQESVWKQIRDFITVDDDFNRIVKNLEGAFTISFNEQVEKNENMSERVCATVKEVWTDRLREKISDSYTVLADLTDDFARVDEDFEDKCKGPSKNRFYVDKYELKDRLKRVLEKRVEAYQSSFFKIFIFLCVFCLAWMAGVISTQTFTFVTGFVILVLSYFYGTNALLKERVDVWFLVDAITKNSINTTIIVCGYFVSFISMVFRKIMDFVSFIQTCIVRHPEILVLFMVTMLILLCARFVRG
jgi:hypothetical protein